MPRAAANPQPAASCIGIVPFRASDCRWPRAAHPSAARRAEAARAVTVKAAIDRYLTEGGRSSKRGAWRPKTAAEWRRIFKHDVEPRWGDRPLSEIAKADVLELVNDKAIRRERKRTGRDDGAAIQAGKMLTRLRTFFAWAAANDLVPADPTAGVLRPAREAIRDRVLNDDEIALLWGAAEQLGVPFGAVFRLLLLTAQRETEVAGMRWSEIDDAEHPSTWTIPGGRAKNGKPHIVHLSGLAAEIIAMRAPAAWAAGPARKRRPKSGGPLVD
jgi:integrase